MKRLVLGVVAGCLALTGSVVAAQQWDSNWDPDDQAPVSNLYLVPQAETGRPGVMDIHQYGEYSLVALPTLADQFEYADLKKIPVEGVESIQYRSWQGSFEPISQVGVYTDREIGLLALVGPFDSDWINHFEGCGIEILDSAPPFGLVVSASPIQMAACTDLRTSAGFQVVRGWVALPIETKISTDLVPILYEGREPSEVKDLVMGPSETFFVRVSAQPNADRQAVLDQVAAFAPRVRGVEANGYDNVFEVNGPEVLDLAEALEGVAFIEGVYRKVLHNNLAVQAHIMNVEPVWNDLGWDGTGIVVDHNDSGVDLSHPDLSGVVLNTYGTMSNTDNAHGTHTAGSVAGRGGASNSPNNTSGCGDQSTPLTLVKGSAPGSELVVNNIFDGGYSTEDLMMRWGYQQGADLSTNSWGYGTLSTYSSYAVTVDGRVRDADTTTGGNQELSIIFSAGNSGPGSSTIGTPGNAKNTLTVGASQNDRCGSYIPTYCSGPDIDTMACFSSRGPAQGRILPDVVGVGTDVLSVESNDPQATNDWEQSWTGPDYALMPGTSMSCPLVAGATAVFHEFYSATFGVDPSPALVKAAMINGAVDMGYGFPSFDQGWGRIDLRRSIEGPPGGAIEFVDQPDVTELSTGSNWIRPFSVGSSAVPLKITVVWTDPPGTANCSDCLVNDLDLIVTDPSGTEYRGNQLTSSWSTENPGSKDDVNNVENVFVQTPETGTWTIEVVSANTSQNPPGLSGQDFVIVFSGYFCDAAPPTGLTATANGDNRIDLDWNPTAGATEYRVYRSQVTGGPYSLVGTVSAPTTSYSDTTVSGNVEYFYVVRNYTDCESGPSGEASATATGTCTASPDFAGVQSVTNAQDATCTLELAWNAATSICGGGLTYNVYRSTDSGFTPAIGNRIASGVSGTGYVDSDTLTYNIPYYYVVRAVEMSNGAEDSNTVRGSGVPTGPITSGTWLDTVESYADISEAVSNGGFSHQADSGTDDWAVTSGTDHTSGNGNSFTSYSQASVTDKWLSTPSRVIYSGAVLTFWHRYDFEDAASGSTAYDGGVIEISIDGGSNWSDLGGDITSGGYDHTISSSYGNPLGGRSAWSGTISSFNQVTVDLASYVGESALIRWRFGCDSSAAENEPWRIDDIQITNAGIAGPCTTGGGCTDPGAVSIDSITDDDPCVQDGVTITFSGGAGASSFDLWVDGGQVATDITSPYGYDPGDSNSHSYVVRAVDGSCSTDSSASALTDETGPGTPTIDSITDDDSCTQSGIRVNYTGGTDATSHDLLRDGSPVVTGYASGALYDPGDGNSYTYSIRALKGSCTADSGGSAFADAADQPGAPTITGITDEDACAQSGIRINYTAGSGAASHDLVRDGGVVVTGYVSGILYNPGDSNASSYVVRAVNGSCTEDSGPTAFTDTNDGLSAPGAPGVTDNDACVQDGVTISWGAVSGATGYEVRIDATTTIYTGSNTSTTYDPGDSGAHTYDVRATNANCTSAWSSGTSATDEAGAPGTPGAPSVTDASSCGLTGVQISWGAVSGATSYDLLVDGTTTVTGVSSPQAYAPGDSGSHTYAVRAVNICGNGAWSAATAGTDEDFSFTWAGIDTAADVDACGDSGVQVLWSTPASWNDGGAGSRSFNVLRNGSPILSGLAEGAVTAFDPTGTNGVVYDYAIQAVNGYGCTAGSAVTASASDEVGSAPSFGGVQSVTVMPDNACGLRVEWNAATPGCGSGIVYNIYRSTTSGFTPDPGTNLVASCVPDLFFEDTNVIGLTNYYYVVRAEDSASGYGGPCNDGWEETNVVEVGGILTAANETGTQLTDPLQITSGSAASAFDPAFTFATAAAAEVDYTLTQGGGVGGTLSYDYDTAANSTVIGNLATTTFSQTVTETETVTAVSTTVSMVPPTRARGGDSLLVELVHASNGTRQTLYSGPRVNWVDGTFGPFATFNGLATDSVWQLVVTHSGGNGGPSNGTLNSWNVSIDYAGSGDPTTCTRVELIDPSATATTLKGYGVADAAPYDVTALYTGPGTYQLRLSENCGNQAEITGATLSVDEPACVVGAAEPVVHFTARSTGANVKLEWENPSSGYGSTRICWDTVSFPDDPTTCTVLVDQDDGAGNYGSFTHGSLTNGTVYYYSAFVDNGSGEFSSRQTVSATPFDNSGQVKWAYQSAASALAPPGLYPGAAGTGAAYGVSNDRVLHGVNSTDTGGDWPRTAPFDWMPMAMNGPAQSRPPVVPTTIGSANLVAFLGSQDGHVYAADAKTGETLWQSEQNYGLVQGAPAGSFAAFGGLDLIFAGSRVAGSGNAMHAMHAGTGLHAWSFGGTMGIISSGPTVDYATERLYFASRENPTGSSDTLWCLSFTDTGATLVWSQPYGDIDSAPVLFDGVLYIGTNAGVVAAIDPATGNKIWSYKTNDGPVKGYVDYEFQATPRRVFFATDSRVWALTDNGATVSYEWDLNTIAGPSIPLTLADQGAMYVGSTDGRLYQVDTTTGGIVTSTLLGDGTATVGSPGYDYLNSLAYVGAEDGSVYAVTLPLQ